VLAPIASNAALSSSRSAGADSLEALGQSLLQQSLAQVTLASADGTTRSSALTSVLSSSISK